MLFVQPEELRRRNPTDKIKRFKLCGANEVHAMQVIDDLISEGVFDDCHRTQDMDQVGIDVVVINHFRRGHSEESRRTREFRLMLQFKAGVDDAATFTQSNPCVIPWVVTPAKKPLQAKIELLRNIVDWLVLHRNLARIDFFRDHLTRYALLQETVEQ